MVTAAAHDIFLSYSRQDLAIASKMAAVLAAAGHDVWWDQALQSGQVYDKVTEKALREARAVVVLWSAAAVESDWVRSEATVAMQRGTLIPVMIEACQRPVIFELRQSADLVGWKGDARDPRLQALLGELAKQLATPAAAATAEPAKTAPQASPSRRGMMGGGAARAALAATMLAGAVAGGIFFWPVKTDAASATLQLGEFKLIGGSVTADLPASIGSELQSAFGANSAVQVTTGKADYLLQGDVRRVGDKFRYTVHLDDVDNGAVLWTGSTDYRQDSELAPRQFAIGASGVIRCALSNTATYPGRLPLTALSLYLQICWDASSLTQGSTGRGLELARRLTVVAPDFSYGWSILGAIGSGPPGTEPEVTGISRAQAVAAVRRALELDPNNAEAYALQAHNLPRNDLVRREQILKHALTLRPSDCGCEYRQYSSLLLSVGRFKEAVENAKRAIDQEPNALGPLISLADTHYIAGDPAAGDLATARLDEIYADRAELAGFRLQSAVLARRWGEAERRLAGVVRDDRQREMFATAFKALRTDDPASRAAAVASLKAAMPAARGPFVALLLAQLGEREAALVAAARFAENGGGSLAILVDPMLASIHNLPGYAPLLEKNGMIKYWKTTRTRPDFCTEPGAPAFCRTLA